MFVVMTMILELKRVKMRESGNFYAMVIHGLRISTGA